MTDAQAVELLERLRDYYREYGDDLASPGKMTIAELAGDLYESLPRGMAPEGLAILDPDAIGGGRMES